MSSSVVPRGNRPPSRSARYSHALLVARVRPLVNTVLAGPNPPAAADRPVRLDEDLQPDRPAGLADFPMTALDAVGARQLALRALLRGRTDP